MQLADINTQVIDNGRVVAVAAIGHDKVTPKPLAYALTISEKRHHGLSLKLGKPEVEYVVSSHLLSAIGWEPETGGLRRVCRTEAETLSLIDGWVDDFRAHGYQAERR